jgi:arsenite methyltransferase
MSNNTFGSAALDTASLRRVIRAEYSAVAVDPQRGFHFHTGQDLARRLGYEPEWTAALPRFVVESFAGTGNPFRWGVLRPGEHVADLGSGAGTDSLIAGRMVGSSGSVVGIDLTPAMVEKARRGAAAAGLDHVRFEEGEFEHLPLADASVDVVISNGVLNLVPDKRAAFREIRRVLRPGGRVQIADILVRKPVGEGAKLDPKLWAGWIAGALLEAELRELVAESGFEQFDWSSMGEVYAGAAQETWAAEYGTIGVQFRAELP